MKKPELKDLTLREKIGQMALGKPSNPGYSDLERYPYGSMWALGNIDMGVIQMKDAEGEIVTNRQRWLAGLRNMWGKTRIPLLPAMDCTAGIHNNFSETEAIMDPVTIGATGSKELAYEAGTLRAQLLRSIGSRWMWYPEIDTICRNKAIGLGRYYSDDPDMLVEMAIAEAMGAQDNGIAATAKHFPGADGLEYRDPHLCSTMLLSTMEEWKQGQGALFQRIIDAGICAVMTSHDAFPACDSSKINGKFRPSSISYKVVTELLKEEMGFDGVVITDGITMRGLSALYGGDIAQVYIEAVKAGNDVILSVTDQFFDIIEDAVKRGEIDESRIDDACRRVINLKEKLGMFDDDYELYLPDLDEINRKVRDFNRRVAEKSQTLVCDNNKILPLSKDKIKNVAIIYSAHDEENGSTTAAHGISADMQVMVEEFEKRGAKVHFQRRLKCAEEIKKLAAENDLLVYAGYLMRYCPHSVICGFFDEEIDTFSFALQAGAEKTVAVGMGSPFMWFDYYTNFPTFINIYNPRAASQRAFVAALYGEIEFGSYHPFELIPEEYRRRFDKLGIEY